MEKKGGNSNVSRVSSYVWAVGFVWAFACPTLSHASSVLPESSIFPEFIKWHVYIVNGLSPNQNLSANCKSADDDLGMHILSPRSNFTWSFRTNFVQSTLYWCNMSKGNASVSLKVFWHDDRLFEMCDWKNCVWIARDDGIYLTNLDEKVEELRHKWHD